MSINTLMNLLSNVGLPCAIVVFMIWRLDKFLTVLGDRFEKYNKELGAISTSLMQLVEYVKGHAS